MKQKPARFRTRITDLRTAEHNPSARYALTFTVDGHTVTYDLGSARDLIDAAIYKLEAAEALVADDQKRRRAWAEARAEARRKVRAQHAQLREAAEAAVSDQSPAQVLTDTRPAEAAHNGAHEPQGGRRQHTPAVALGQGMDSITLAKVSEESNGGD